jgi:hypothetical protein
MSESLEQETVTVPRGDPIFSIWIWRADSITLTRLRPVLEHLASMAEAKCENYFTGSCLDDPGRRFDTGEGATSYCWPCRLKTLVVQLHAVTGVGG